MLGLAEDCLFSINNANSPINTASHSDVFTNKEYRMLVNVKRTNRTTNKNIQLEHKQQQN